MKCERVQELLSDYYEGSVDVALSEMIRAHMAKCPSCKREFEQMKSMWTVLNSMPTAEPPADFRQSIMRKLEEVQNAKRLSKQKSGLGWLFGSGRIYSSRGFLAAGAALILAAVLFVVPQHSDKYASGAFNPDIPSITHKADSGSQSIAPVIDMAEMNKQNWMARNLVHNAVWVKVEPDTDGTDEMLYNIKLTVNKNAGINEKMLESMDVSVYIVDDGMFNTSVIKNSKPEWKGALTDGSTITIPVAVDKDLETLDVFILCKSNVFEFGKYVFLPYGKSDAAAAGVPGSEYRNIYKALQKLAAVYNVSIIADSGFNTNVPYWESSSATLAEELKAVLRPAGFDWLCVDGAVYVDRDHSR